MSLLWHIIIVAVHFSYGKSETKGVNYFNGFTNHPNRRNISLPWDMQNITSNSSGELNFDVCASNPCLNGSVCINDSNGYICLCLRPAYAGNCEIINPCNGLLTGDMNITIYSDYSISQVLNVECVWKVLAPENKQIQLTILKLVSDQTGLCNDNHIRIIDVDKGNSYPAENFCNINPPKIIISIFNELLIKYNYHWNHKESLTAIARLANEGYFYELNGTLRSPLYPNQYPNNKENIYIIKQLVGMRICLTFQTFNIEYCGGCSCDYLEIHDGFREEDPLIGKYCGTQISRSIISKSNTLWLKFKSNRLVQSFGFSAYYTAFECSGLFTELNGAWKLPTFRNPYAAIVECFYIIMHKPGMAIAFSITSDNPQYVKNCSQMSLNIHDGLNKDAPLINQYCNDTSTIIYSKTNALWIKFRWDTSLELPHHIIHYNTFECGGKFTKLEGVLKSPSYFHPNSSQNIECIYLITTQSPTAYISLYIHDFNFNSDCSLAYLEVRDGNYAKASLIGHYCMTNIPVNITSTNNNLWLKFKTIGKLPKSSFHISYSVHNLCGGIFSEPSGVLQSPQFSLFNNQSSHIQDCFYIIKPSSISFVYLIFTFFEIEYYPNCIYEYLEIRNVSKIGKYCGYKTPGTIVVETNVLSLHLRTYNPLYSKGFQAIYIISNKMFREQQHVFSSLLFPLFPKFNYPFGLEYIYVIKREFSCLIEVTFYNFDIEYESNYINDHIEIRIGSNQNGSLLADYYDSTLFPLISVNTSSLWIKVTPGKLQNRREFSISYSISDCIYMFSEEVGTLTCPSYEKDTSSNVQIHQCHYIIKWKKNWSHTNLGSSNVGITVTFNDFFSSFDCYNEFMEIQISQKANHTMLSGKYCRYKTLNSILILDDDIFLKIRISSWSYVSERKIAYYTVSNKYCGGVLNQRHGVLTSPLYNESHGNSMVCNYLIIGKPNFQIQLVINNFNIESFDASCNLNFLEIRNGSHKQAPLVGKYCKHNTPPHTIISTSDSLFLQFQFNLNLKASEFEIRYDNAVSINTITNAKGELISPNYPDKYPNDVDKIYIINLKSNCLIYLTFHYFDLEVEGQCGYDYLQINDGPDEKSPQLGKWCGDTIPEPIISKSNILRFKFQSDSSSQFTGFKIRYTYYMCQDYSLDKLDKESDPNTYTLDNAAISYPFCTEFDNTSCEIRIILPALNSISLFFNYFSLGDNTDCENDFLEVREGDSKLGILIGQYCGFELPLPIYAGNKIWMKVNISSLSINRIVDITYTSSSHICGGNLMGWYGTFANPISANTSCEWIIWAPFGRRVNLKFKKFTFIAENYCSNNYIELRDGASKNSSFINRYCGSNYPPNIIASKNVLYVKYVSNLNSSVNAFTAVYFY